MWMVKGVAYVLVALLTMSLGLAMFSWGLFNGFVETETELDGHSFMAVLISCGLGVPLVGIGLFWLRIGYKYLISRTKKAQRRRRNFA